MSKKNNNGKLLFLILFICFAIALINMFSLKDKTISKKSTLDNVNEILSTELSSEISTLKTEKDSDSLYAFYKDSNNKYGLASFKRNNVLYNRYEFDKNLLDADNKKFNFVLLNNDTCSKVILSGDFSRTTASSIKVSYNNEIEKISIDKKEPTIKILGVPIKDSKNINVEIFDEFENEITNAL